jgi:predicted secreted Zn-dependent protease
MSIDYSSTDWHYYDVGGATLADVVAAIESYPEAGSAEWWPRYSVATEDGNVTEATITIDTRITLPNWTDRDAASSAEQAEWDRFLQALTEHENGHIHILVTQFTDIDTQMVGKSEHDAKDVFDGAVTQLQQATNDYDSSTDHGRLTGTVVDLSVCP